MYGLNCVGAGKFVYPLVLRAARVAASLARRLRATAAWRLAASMRD